MLFHHFNDVFSLLKQELKHHLPMLTTSVQLCCLWSCSQYSLYKRHLIHWIHQSNSNNQDLTDQTGFHNKTLTSWSIHMCALTFQKYCCKPLSYFCHIFRPTDMEIVSHHPKNSNLTYCSVSDLKQIMVRFHLKRSQTMTKNKQEIHLLQVIHLAQPYIAITKK